MPNVSNLGVSQCIMHNNLQNGQKKKREAVAPLSLNFTVQRKKKLEVKD